MLKILCRFTLILGIISLSPAYTQANEIEIGKKAPYFSATDIYGHNFDLEEQKGKIVVLEWTNHQCPFVLKHYGSGNMQATQKAATDDGVIWVSIVSSAPGKQGHVSAQDAQTIVKDVDAHATTRIMDESGGIGKLYDAKTTPHMFVIDADGVLVYAGAIDSIPSPNPKTIAEATNYVSAALSDLKADREIQTPITIPYGCAVKY